MARKRFPLQEDAKVCDAVQRAWDERNPEIVDALMGALTLRELVPDEIERNAATEAFKQFLVRAFGRREDRAAAEEEEEEE